MHHATSGTVGRNWHMQGCIQECCLYTREVGLQSKVAMQLRGFLFLPCPTQWSLPEVLHMWVCQQKRMPSHPLQEARVKACLHRYAVLECTAITALDINGQKCHSVATYIGISSSKPEHILAFISVFTSGYSIHVTHSCNTHLCMKSFYQVQQM